MSVKQMTIILIFITIYITTIKSCYSNFSIDDGTSNKCTLNSVMKNIIKHFPCNSLVTVISASENINSVLLSLNTDICFNIIVRTACTVRNWRFVADVYVIVAEDIYELSTKIFQLSYNFYWAPKARYIIHVHYVTDLRQIFKIFLNYNMYDVILLVCIDGVTEVFTYFPFANGNCGKDFDEVVNLNTTSAIRENYSMKKVPNTLRNCKFKVVLREAMPFVNLGTSNYSTYERYMKGIEQYVLSNIGEIEGIIFEYFELSKHILTSGFVLPNGTVTDQLAYVQDGRADIALGGCFLMQNQAQLFDYIWGYKYSRFFLFTSAKRFEQWKNVYKEFNLTTWILIIAAYWFIVAVCLSILRLSPAEKNSTLNTMLVLWGLYLWNGSKRILQVKRLRPILVCWIWYSFFIINFYSSYFYSLIASYNQKVIDYDVKKMNSSILKPCVGDNIRSTFFYTHSIRFPPNVNLEACHQSISALEAVAASNNLFTVQRHYNYLTNKYKFFDDNQYRKVDLKRIGHTMNIAMYLKKGFPLQNKLKLHAKRMFDSGIVNKHLEKLLNTKYVFRKTATRFSKLSLSDLRIGFLILLLGIIISMLCCLLEISISKCNKLFFKG